MQSPSIADPARRTSPSSRHPLSSGPNSPPESSSPYRIHPTVGTPPATSATSYLAPSHGTFPDGSARLPSRSPSPGLTSRRRRKADGHPSVQQQETVTPDYDNYDPKGRPSAGLTLHAGTRSTPSHAPFSTLDRLESFFGISNDPSPLQRKPSRPAPTADSPTTSPVNTGPPGTRLVLQHTVQSTDTLQSLALRYKTDVATLRKVNGLWPNDSVLSRKILWVPLDRCKELGTASDATVGLQSSDGNVVESTPSALGLLSRSATGTNSPTTSSAAPLPPHLLHHRTFSSSSLHDSETASSNRLSTSQATRSRPPSTSASASAASISKDASASPSDSLNAPPVVRRLPSEVLGHFPAAKRSDTHLLSTKGKSRADQWNEELLDARPKHRLGPGPGMSGYDPGQSGVEDLLQLAREARSRGSTDDDIDKAAEQRLQAIRSATVSSTPALGDEITPDESRSEAEAVDDEQMQSAKSHDWKPNVWHFGDKKQSLRSSQDGVNGTMTQSHSNGSGASSSPSSSLRPLKLVDQSIEQWQSSSPLRPTQALPPPATSSSYQGWNDIPTLDAYAKGKVVEAYSNQRGGGAGKKKKSQRAFLDDLAAGLPANSGQASKWARPIGDSVPFGASGAGSKGANNAPTGRTATSSPSLQPGTSSWRNLFSDTLRGRMPLDQALSIGFEDLMSSTEWNSLPSEEMEHARRLQQERQQGQRRGQAPPPEMPRRKSQHEMQTLEADYEQQQHQQHQQRGYGRGMK